MQGSKSGTLADSLLDFLETVVTAVFFVVILFTFIMKLVTVSGKSMENTLGDGDMLIVRNLFYTPKQGDIIVVSSDTLEKLIIKRVIAVSGQKVTIDYNNDKVYVCDRDKEPTENDILDEPYILEHDMKDPENHFSESFFDEKTESYVYTVPVGYVFVLGDNRNDSTDSRAIGLIDLGDIEGKAVLRFLSPTGKGIGIPDRKG